MIHVTCAIILKDEKVLLVQRSEHMPQPLEWEFPGGKVDAGETETACLIRKIQEELQITIVPVKRLSPVQHSYPGKTILLIPYLCEWQSGTISLTEHNAFKWVKPGDLKQYQVCAADVPIVEELLQLLK
ncbi:MAG: (deoxy)nucleoside triphosphate pyrophosphohydrolase [Hymenobacteraceae bacterium]|nr:(deoxy)nucleoside triphosphate pyrophosphohydrolase [Hymenobacteraceae bacterium]MDX5397632.1 (deoxy)nucleoside triphosphate pyrophosphohydrolase [Hymenobacteraceae bacterium]MDX5443801.1 (deoxy)nucleoside triphosphate pyrophosphohydrolase [Hymenobacteraceae bacterium]MDX5513709.1 (deoxy)nucleoside triphosphate pyrophosphohydrolase [Hymenobacteraceae bacterium]